MRCRLVTESDMDDCLALAHNDFYDDLDMHYKMPAIWTAMLRAGTLHGGIIEDVTAPPEERVQALTLAIYVEDGFVDDYFRHPVPGISKRVYENQLAGHSPALTPRALRRANGGAGVNLLFLHTGTRHYEPQDPQAAQIGVAVREMVVLLHAGYRTRLILQEVLGPVARGALQTCGYNLLHDFRSYFEAHGGPPPPDQHPYLFGADSNSAQAGNPMLMFFYPSAPSFGFSDQQQTLLLHALFNENDDQIAALLGISVETVRKHWRAIYERVANVAPGFFPDDNTEPARGPGKRSHLLNFLRYRPEELRPPPNGSDYR